MVDIKYFYFYYNFNYSITYKLTFKKEKQTIKNINLYSELKFYNFMNSIIVEQDVFLLI